MIAVYLCLGLELQPEDWLTLDQYGEVLGRQGKRECAAEAFQQAVHFQMLQEQ